MSVAIDMLTRLFSIIDLVDHDTLVVLPKHHLISAEEITRNVQGAVILLGDEIPESWSAPRNIYFFSIRGIPEQSFWIDLIKSHTYHETLTKIKSLITKDIKEVSIVARESSRDALLAYEALNELRRINTEARVKVLLDIPKSGRVLNTATFLALALDRGLLDIAAVANVSRMVAKLHVLNEVEKVQELRWCLANLTRAADKALENNVYVAAAMCYSTSVPEIFNDLQGFIRFSRFASWGTEYQSLGMYGTIEGPAYIVNNEQLKELARKEGWIHEGVELKRGNKLRVAALEVKAQVLREFLQSALAQTSGREGDTITGYVELYKVAGYIESLIKKLWG